MERDIMQKYSFSGQRCTIISLLLVIGSFIVYGFFQLLPSILDIIFPLNETRPFQPYALTEYFIDERTYYNLLLCHWLFGVFFNSFILVATMTLHLVYIEHICGICSVANYRIEHSTDHYASHNLLKKKDHMTVQNISAAVNLHQKALMYGTSLSTTFALDFFLMVVVGVLSLSLNLFRLLNAISMQRNMNELFTSIILVSIHFLIMYLNNYYGQKLTDHNNKMFYNTYKIRWYTVPVRIQKLFLFIMTRTTKTYVLNIGNLIMASIEGFSKLASLSISYFAAIYSLQ
ncbi:uncharacterized protein LOC109503783 isoform X2 [Harpegnathos saltator]|uniref:uncharacterized protein LOC109503783 isoform X2 n=1 Tax=Harpegnathos saltator TaxID=610380 RepID=UPI000DBEE011|nr:uncharacterized protein LOC109503783 isoform X2 [Harpegnathos saltator]